MMVLLLVTILLIEEILFYLNFKNKLTSISLWVTGMLLFSSIAYVVNLNYFGKDISGTTLLIIEISVLCYFCGEIIGQKIRVKSRNCSYEQSCREEYVIPWIYCLLCFVFLLAVAVYRVYSMYQFALTKGHSQIKDLISFMYPYIAGGEYGNTGLVGMISSIGEACAYIFGFYFVYNYIFLKKLSKRLLLPILGHFVIMATSGGRTGFLKFFLIVMGLTYILIKKSGMGTKTINRKYIFTVIKLALLMILVFYIYGVLFRHSSRTISQYFANYFSAGLYGLNYYIDNPWPSNHIFGEYTLANFYYYLDKFGAVFNIPAHNLPFFSWTKSQSNIYTGFVLPIQDYGIWGMWITRFFIAIIFSMLEKKVMDRKTSKIYVTSSIVFGYFMYVNFSIPIADRFKEFLTVTTFPLFVLSLVVINKWYIRCCKR